MAYLNRIADELLRSKLEAFGAVVIEGPKWCGKTTTAMQQAASVLQMQDPDYKESYLATAHTKPSLLLVGDEPRLIDEWQIAPVLWDAVRVAVDKRGGQGHFILTGSNSVDSSAIMHSGIGRISRMKMYPMSLWESQDSNGSVSLSELFDNKELDIDGCVSPLSVEQLIFLACRGGWPATMNMRSDKARLMVASDYLTGVCNIEIKTIDGVQRNATLTRLILKSYARNIATLAKKVSLLKDVQPNMESISMSTFDNYIHALEQLFVIEDLEAWCPAIRSASAIRNGKKRCFTDPSIAVAALDLAPRKLYTDLRTFGFLFEVMAIRDLRVYSQGLGGHLSYYHDRYDLEADAVLHLPDGRYALIEIKLGSRDIEEGAKHLLELKQLVVERNERDKKETLRVPDLLIVLTGGQMAYTRLDGVKIIPLGCLKD
jgi:predicted AAA+ superfamily ATPase